MTDSPGEPTPPENLPDNLVTDLEELRPDELRTAIIYAQELLRARHEPDSLVTPGEHEDILRVTEYDGYTEVVKQHYCGEGCQDCPHGPYLYHVTEEPEPDGGSHTYWSLIGPATIDEE